jgi:large subunit ribosomal protein L10
MANTEKDAVIRDVTDIFQKAKSVFVTDFSGLNVEHTMQFRKKCRESKQVGPHFKGPSAIAYSYDDPSSPARVIKEFNKTHDKPKIKVSLFEGTFYGPEHMDMIASLPSKKELLSRVVGGFNSPIQGLVGALNGLLQKLVGTLDAVKSQKEKSA